MKSLPLVLAIAAALLAGGCDQLYGVRRTAELSGQPELECVRSAIEHTEGVTSVTYRASHDGKGLFHANPWVYDYVYRGPDGIWGSLQLIRDYNGHFSYENTRFAMHKPPPQGAIDATRPVMRLMEKNIAARCAIIELNAAVSESCTGISCKPLPN